MGMKSTKGIFDELELDIGGALLENGLVDDLLHYQDLSNRKLFLASDITQDIVSDIVRNILQYNTEDKEIPTEERNQSSFTSYRVAARWTQGSNSLTLSCTARHLYIRLTQAISIVWAS